MWWCVQPAPQRHTRQGEACGVCHPRQNPSRSRLLTCVVRLQTPPGPHLLLGGLCLRLGRRFGLALALLWVPHSSSAPPPALDDCVLRRLPLSGVRIQRDGVATCTSCVRVPCAVYVTVYHTLPCLSAREQRTSRTNSGTERRSIPGMQYEPLTLPARQPRASTLACLGLRAGTHTVAVDDVVHCPGTPWPCGTTRTLHTHTLQAAPHSKPHLARRGVGLVGTASRPSTPGVGRCSSAAPSTTTTGLVIANAPYGELLRGGAQPAAVVRGQQRWQRGDLGTGVCGVGRAVSIPGHGSTHLDQMKSIARAHQ